MNTNIITFLEKKLETMNLSLQEKNITNAEDRNHKRKARHKDTNWQHKGILNMIPDTKTLDYIT